jgi:hypothetical protein
MGEPDPIVGFRCVFRSEMCEDDECGLYLAECNGEIFVTLENDEDDDTGRRAGTTRLFILNADAAENDNVDLCELLDRRSETAALIPLIGEEPGNLSSAVCDCWTKRWSFAEAFYSLIASRSCRVFGVKS